jgi:hypothetical protein
MLMMTKLKISHHNRFGLMKESAHFGLGLCFSGAGNFLCVAISVVLNTWRFFFCFIMRLAVFVGNAPRNGISDCSLRVTTENEFQIFV